DDCQKVPKRVGNRVDKEKGGSSGADDDGFIKVEKKKSGGNTGGTKYFKPFSLSNSFEALHVDNLVSEEVDLGNMASTSSVQEEGQSITPVVECLGDLDSENEVEPDDNEMASFLAKPSGLDIVQRSCWSNGGKYMVMLTTTRTMMTCMKVRKFLTMFKLYAITWISRFEVDQRNRLLDDFESIVVWSLYVYSLRK
ncbi:hypothetical protein Tco_0861763, partial [Tanacetum coccineum]